MEFTPRALQSNSCPADLPAAQYVIQHSGTNRLHTGTGARDLSQQRRGRAGDRELFYRAEDDEEVICESGSVSDDR